MTIIVIFSRKKIQRIMKKYGIICPHRRPNPYKKIAKATKEHQVVPNKLNREFKQGIPGKVLLTDITYLPYNENCILFFFILQSLDCQELFMLPLPFSHALKIVQPPCHPQTIEMALYTILEPYLSRYMIMKSYHRPVFSTHSKR